MNTIKKIIYYYAIPLFGRFCRRHNKFINVIYYHDIVQGEGASFQHTNIEYFKKQMEYLYSHGYNTVRFDECAKYEPFDKKKVIIAFDDGWRSNYDILSFMKSKGLKYNIFLTIGEIGNNPDYLSWNQVREMHETGMVGFGVHTYSHADMSDIEKVDLEIEFSKADAVFENELGYPPKDFCYPYGYYSAKSNEYITKNCKYDHVYTASLMNSYLQNGTVIFGRSGISNDEPMIVFKSKSKGYFNVFNTLVNR